ncbi:Isochorismatase hydrolase [Plenodomus tracheiphilus IPT5]|uniref:Isochorismatase hydrolase n=1 Tax=Plenodomus tracheiphilus IPT5 TaxID=1408161 RepID=A0A6A7BEI0_9PLEO|nr:Isochorismatase hydrolase [Plenodomus tracheiphilus IPT5]
MSSTLPQGPHHKALIGSPLNFWLHSSQTGFNLTHPSTPSYPPNTPTLTLNTTKSPITISPSKSALIIIDMQNFFLSEALGKKRGPGHTACDNLITYAIPAARKAGIRVVWLNWGLTDKDMKIMPPAVRRAFGFDASPHDIAFADGDAVFTQHEQHPDGASVDKHGKMRDGAYKGLGAEMGSVRLADGSEVDAGRLLMRHSWNAALYPPLAALYEQGSQLPTNPDVWIHKDRMSGLWGARTECEDFLRKEGIQTLLFTGVNTDQCVGGSLTDAFSKGYDCVLLKDACGTSSPEFAQQAWEWNVENTFGFVVGCEDFAKGAEEMET